MAGGVQPQVQLTRQTRKGRDDSNVFMTWRKAARQSHTVQWCDSLATGCETWKQIANKGKSKICRTISPIFENELRRENKATYRKSFSEGCDAATVRQPIRHIMVPLLSSALLSQCGIGGPLLGRNIPLPISGPFLARFWAIFGPFLGRFWAMIGPKSREAAQKGTAPAITWPGLLCFQFCIRNRFAR